MAALLLILLCGATSSVTSGYKSVNDEGQYYSAVEKTKIEIYEYKLDHRMIKRSTNGINDIGGSNDNVVDGQASNGSDNVVTSSDSINQLADYSSTSGNTVVNNINKSTAIPTSAISQANHTSAIVTEQLFSTSQFQNQNKSDVSTTPAAHSKEIYPQVTTSLIKSSNIVDGSNHNTTPNQSENDIAQITTQRPSENILTGTTLHSTENIPPQPESTISPNTTLQTPIEPQSDLSSPSPTQNPSGDSSNGVLSTTITGTIFSAVNEPTSEPVSSVTNFVPGSESSAVPEVNNDTDSESANEPEPIPEPKTNTTVAPDKLSTVVAVSDIDSANNNLTTSVPETTTDANTSSSGNENNAQTTKSTSNTTNTPTEDNNTGVNTVVEGSPEPTEKPNNVSTNSVAPNANQSTDPEHTESPTGTTTFSNHSRKDEQTAIPSETTTVTTPSPEDEVTPETEGNKTTHSITEAVTQSVGNIKPSAESTGENITDSSLVTMHTTASSSTKYDKTIPTPEPIGNSTTEPNGNITHLSTPQPGGKSTKEFISGPGGNISPEPTSKRNENSTLEPTPEPTWSSMPESTPEPSGSSTPEPTPEPSLSSTPEPTPEQSESSTPDPNGSSTPEPTPEPSGSSTPEPTPEAIGRSTPEPTPEPSGSSTPESTPEPSWSSTPESIPEPSRSTPESTPEPSGSSTQEPTPESSEINISSPEPTQEPDGNSSPPDTTDKPGTTATAEPLINLTTTLKDTIDPISQPEDHSSTKSVKFDNVTHSTPEPTEEPTGNVTDKNQPEPETDDTEGEPELDLNVFAEPGPDWKLAKGVWKEAWELHVYFFGISFAILGLYCCAILMRLWNMQHLLSKNYFITLQILVILVCFLRATYLFIDAYNSLGTFPLGVDYFLYSTAFPCLTALFSILFYSLLLATRVRVISQKIQKLWVLVFIVSIHFILSIATDIFAGLFTSASVMMLICQVFFLIWGLFMFVGYLVLFRKLYKGAVNRQKVMKTHHREQKNTSNAYHVKPSRQKYTLGLAVKITFISAFFGLAIAGFELYGMFGVYGILNSDTKPAPWPWWTYHTIVRGLELLMCVSIAYVASQPLRYRIKKKTFDHKIYHYLLPCSICCCPDSLDQNETYNSTDSLDYVVSETDHLSWLKKLKNKKTCSPDVPYPPHTAEKYSDPDATLLVRKIRRSRPSMLVVEEGFVRIRREDEILPSNQYELDTYSRSSHSSDLNLMGPGYQNTGAISNVVNWNYTEHNSQSGAGEIVPGVNFDNYKLQGNITSNGYANTYESSDETDIDIVVTESEHESDSRESPEGDGSGESNKSADIFRPLSLIDLAASMESELDRAFNSNCVMEADLISHHSLPTSFECYTADSNDCSCNNNLNDKYCDRPGAAMNLDEANYSSDSADDQPKSSAACLIRSPIQRSKSDDSPASAPKCKHFEKNKYFSVSSVDTIGRDDDQHIDYDQSKKV